MFEEATSTAHPSTMPDEATLREAMQPKLSDDTFDFKWREKVDGKYIEHAKKVTIMPLVVEHQNRFTKAAGDFMDILSFSVESQRWFSAMADGIRGAEVLPQLVRIIAENDEVEITDEMMAKCLLQPDEMLDIVKRWSYKNEAVGGPIKNFFENVWPPIRQNVKNELLKSWSDLTKAVQVFESAPNDSAEPVKTL